MGSGGRESLGKDPKAGESFPVSVPGVKALREQDRHPGDHTVRALTS